MALMAAVTWTLSRAAVVVSVDGLAGHRQRGTAHPVQAESDLAGVGRLPHGVPGPGADAMMPGVACPKEVDAPT